MPEISEPCQWRSFLLLTLTTLALSCLTSLGAQADESEKSWLDLRGSLFDDRPIQDGSALLSLSAPYRAENPALVPVEIKILHPADLSRRIKSLTLIVDENPVPLAATFSISPDAQISAMETRLRVNAYSFVRVLAELEDGSLHMVKRYVKATGGCAAPASGNPEEALASMGQMRLRKFPHTEGPPRGTEFQLQIKHPNYSGLQMNQVTGLYRAAHFVETITISADGKPIISAEGAISLSENPSLRFTYSAQPPKTLSAHIKDTEDNVFEKSWDVAKLPGGKDS